MGAFGILAPGSWIPLERPTRALDSLSVPINLVLLPGIVMPAAIRYQALLQHLEGENAVVKDLEIYREAQPPSNFSIADEVEGLARAADEAGFDRFHVYGHSGGGAVALAFALARPERLCSLALDEPASDFTDDCNATYGWEEFDRASALPPAEATRAFLALQVSSGVELPPPPPGAPPPWMAQRPAGIQAFIRALRSHHVDPAAYGRFSAPVYYSRGSLTHPRWERMERRLSPLFPRFSSEVFDGLHHLNTSHQAEPERVATRLRALWRLAS
jgi:pimeloyl-ACP methyl ester carboxylesterase